MKVKQYLFILAAVFVLGMGCTLPDQGPDLSGLLVYQGTFLLVNGSGSYNFGQVSADGNNLTVGQTISFTVKNNGATSCSLLSMTVNSPDFDITIPSLPATVNSGGGTRSFSIRFDPLTKGDKIGTFTIIYTDPNPKSYTFTVRGTGVDPKPLFTMNKADWVDDERNLTPVANQHTFELGTVGFLNQTYEFVIVNTGDATLNLTSYGTTNACSFVSSPVPTSLARNGGEYTVNVRFSGSVAGSVTGSVTIVSNDPERSPFTLNFHATLVFPEE